MNFCQIYSVRDGLTAVQDSNTRRNYLACRVRGSGATHFRQSCGLSPDTGAFMQPAISADVAALGQPFRPHRMLAGKSCASRVGASLEREVGDCDLITNSLMIICREVSPLVNADPKGLGNFIPKLLK
jgi:hypothetical protein